MKDSSTRSPAPSAIVSQASSGLLSQRSYCGGIRPVGEAVEFIDQDLGADRPLDQSYSTVINRSGLRRYRALGVLARRTCSISYVDR
jgi:hypothetical protein